MIRDRLEWIPLTMYAIFRNKRRSFAMISGIILGVTILSGIFIYSAILNEQNFQSVVESASYEVRFDILDNETVADLHALANIVEDDERVLATTVIGREPADYIPAVIFDNKIDVSTGGQQQGPPVFSALSVPVFVEDGFIENEIGRNFVDNLDGAFDFTDDFNATLGGFENSNKTVISRSLASKYQYEVNDIIEILNITYTKLDQSQGFSAEIFEDYLTNVKVVGIYEEVTADAGIFGDLFSIEEIYFSTRTLERSMPEAFEAFTEDRGFYLAVKIDESMFSVDDPEKMSEELDQFINAIAKLGDEMGLEIDGDNEIEFLLLPFQFSSFFITLFDVLLAAPVVILSLYLLFFGLEMSLEERRREIAIKKVQGADSKQIFAELRSEAILLFIIGSIIGYIMGIIGAWVISSAVGFMRVQIGTADDFLNFFTLDVTAIQWSVAIVGGIMTMQTIRQGKAFIESEVTESVQKFEGTKEGFVKRNKIDYILFIIGIAGIIASLLEHQFNVDLNLSLLWSILINGLGPFFLWIGGALVGARVTKYIPLRFERIFLALPSLKDINRIIRSGLRRRGDTNRLAIIIVLTLSIATLAAAQGNTEQVHVTRNLEWEIGSDMQVDFGYNADFSENLTRIDGIDRALSLDTSAKFRILSDNFEARGIDIDAEYDNLINDRSIGIWHEDSFRDLSPEKALSSLQINPYGIFISNQVGNLLGAEVGETLKLKVLLAVDPNASPFAINDVEILGFYDHAPGGVIGTNILTSDKLILRINALSENKTMTAYDGLKLNSSKYLMTTDKGDAISIDEINEIKRNLAQIVGYQSMRSLYQELSSKETQIGNFGVSGLLSLNFLVAVTAAIISTFAFSAILMERRRREFAVLRAIGSRKSQIYKLALAENTMMVFTAVVWGSIIGLGITFQFNGVFELFGVFLGGGPLNRIVSFPFLTVTLIGIFTTLGMLLATMISVRSAANQDLSTATRVI